jgi:hypothetical protein
MMTSTCSVKPGPRASTSRRNGIHQVQAKQLSGRADQRALGIGLSRQRR